MTTNVNNDSLCLNRQSWFGTSLVRQLKQYSVPFGWVTDWAKQPDPFKSFGLQGNIYLDPFLPLLNEDNDSDGMQSLMENCSDLELLAFVLMQTAPHQLRLVGQEQIDNLVRDAFVQHSEVALRVNHCHAARMVPSGGALYPWEIYLNWNDPESPLNGRWHYDMVHHALHPLGDPLNIDKLALHADSEEAFGYLIITACFWKNYFKYANASLQLQNLDSGVLASNLARMIQRCGLQAEICLDFVDGKIAAALALDLHYEAPALLIRITGKSAVKAPSFAVEPSTQSTVSFDYRDFVENSVAAESFRYSCLESLPPTEQKSTVARKQKSKQHLVSLPASSGIDFTNQCFAQSRWRTSGIDASKAHTLDITEFSELCAQAFIAAKDTPNGAFPLELYVAVNSVEGIPPDIYQYYEQSHGLLRIASGQRYSDLIQGAYNLENVAFDKASCVFFIVSRYVDAIALKGNRGIRNVNLVAGIMVERVYWGCEALGIGCHALLGFDDLKIDSILKLNPREHWVLIGIVLGNKNTSFLPPRFPVWI